MFNCYSFPMYIKAIMSIMNGNSIGNFSYTNTTTYFQIHPTMASEKTETILIVILLSFFVLLWVGVCYLINTSEYGTNDFDQNAETSNEYISKQNLSGDLNLLQNRRESLGHIYENKLSDDSLPWKYKNKTIIQVPILVFLLQQ